MSKIYTKYEKFQKYWKNVISEKYFEILNFILFSCNVIPLELYSPSFFSFEYMGANSCLTWEIIEANLDKPWNWKYVSKNLNITWAIIKANLDKPWDWYELSRHPNITWAIIKANLDKPWDWCELSRHPNITWEIIEANMDKPWDCNEVIRYPNLNIDFITTKPDKEQYLPGLSNHPNLTFDTILNNLDSYWNWKKIRFHQFAKQREITIENVARQWMASYKIQQVFRVARYNPSYKLCNKIQIESYNTLIEMSGL